MNFRLKKFLSVSFFIFLLLIAIFFRFWQFGKIPPGLNRDEASIGYTAYSILKTARDEYGNFLPLSIKSFGDWKLPAYIYLVLPFVALFGLNDWVIRLPSALAGIFTLIIVYFLTKELFKNSKFVIAYSLLTILLLSLLPWHIHFSRAGYEANLALLFLTFAVFLFLKGLKQPIFLPFSALFFGLTLFTYHTYHLFTPLFLIGTVLLFYPKLKTRKNKNFAFVSLVIFLILAGVIFKETFDGSVVKSSISFLTDPVFIHSRINLPRTQISNQFLGRLLYNKPVVFSRIFISNFFASFSPSFLAIKGGEHPIHNIPGIGNIFWFEYPLFLLGFYFLLSQKTKKSLLLLWWLLISPIASSLTKDAPNTVRMTLMIIPLTLIISLGFVHLFNVLKDGWQRSVFGILVGVIFVQSLMSFYRAYFINFPFLRAKHWGAGYQQLVNYLNLAENKEKHVLMQRPNYSPYIYFLFYSSYNPATYQHEAVRYPPTEDGFYHVRAFSRYQFKDFKLEDEVNQDKLIVVWAETISKERLNSNSAFLKNTIYERSQPLFYVFEGQPNPSSSKVKPHFLKK